MERNNLEDEGFETVKAATKAVYETDVGNRDACREDVSQLWLTADQDVLPDGKHRGKTFEEIMAEDPMYASWVMDLNIDGINSSAMLRFQRFLEDRGFPTPVKDVMPVGKHKGKTFQEIMTEDPSYCAATLRSIAENGTDSSAMLRFKKFLEHHKFALLPSEEVLPIGKHRGKTFEEIMTEDPMYASWVMDLNIDGINNSAMLRFQRFLQDRGCQAPVKDVMTVGKHKGKTFQEVMTEDPSYCAVMLRVIEENGTDSSALLRLKNFLENTKFSLPPSQEVLRSGKYEGKTFEEVMVEDPLYCRWVMDLNIAGTNGSSVRRFKELLEERGYHAPEDVMTMGKHRGKSFEEVMAQDPSYCASLTRLIDLKGTNNSVWSRFKKFLEIEGFSLPLSEEVLQSGKHKGKLFKEVMAEDPLYCTRVMGLTIEAAAALNVLGLRRFLEDRGHQAPAGDTLTIGKYEGKTFEEVMTEDPSYCAWVMDLSTEETHSSVFLRLKQFLEDRGFQAHAEDVMIVGKHKGKTFQEIMKEDPSYCDLMMRLMAQKDTDSSVMLRFKKFLENKGFIQHLSKEVFQVGKHKGKTFEEVMSKDPMYGSWVMELSRDNIPTSTTISMFKAFLEDTGVTAPSEDIITVGKHRGKTFEEVMAEDPSYCRWVVDLSTEDTDTISMLRFKKFLVDNGFQTLSSTRGATADEKTSGVAPANILTVGKHKGKAFEKVMKTDPDYCLWVIATGGTSLLSFKSFLMDNGFVDPSQSL